MTETAKGFEDFSGELAKKRQKILEIIIRKFKQYGFEPAETPIIEQESFVKGENSDDEAVSDIFRLSDKGKRKLALRYEFTFQLKRLAKNKKLPYKRFQIGPVFRDEPVTKNRVRQFIQCDVDIIGSTIKDDAEILALSADLLGELKIPFKINVNNRKLLNEILDGEGIKAKDREQVIREIDKLDKLSEEEISKNLKKYKAEKVLKAFKQPASFFKKYKAYKDVEQLLEYCKLYGIKVNFLPSLARGLSYYTGSTFEIKMADAPGSIAGGGSYMIGNNQATGIAFGLRRLSKLAQVPEEKDKIMLLSIDQDKEAITLAQKLRKKGKSVLIYYGKPSKALAYANTQDISQVIFAGEKEVKSKKYKSKDMKTGKESSLKL